MDLQRAVLVHDMPAEGEFYEDHPSQAHWLPWLRDRLEARGLEAANPDMPDAFGPEYEAWESTFDDLASDEPMVLIGHGCGAGFLLRWLSEHQDAYASNVVFVAPWLDPFRDETEEFFEFEIDENLLERVDQLHVLYSTDSGSAVLTSVEMILEALPDVIQHRYAGVGRFTERELEDDTFPDVLNIIKG